MTFEYECSFYWTREKSFWKQKIKKYMQSTVRIIQGVLKFPNVALLLFDATLTILLLFSPKKSSVFFSQCLNGSDNCLKHLLFQYLVILYGFFVFRTLEFVRKTILNMFIFYFILFFEDWITYAVTQTVFGKWIFNFNVV